MDIDLKIVIQLVVYVVGVVVVIMKLSGKIGALETSVEGLKKAVLNGLSTKQEEQGKELAEHKAALERIDERCGGRKEWIDGLEKDVKDLQKVG